MEGSLILIEIYGNLSYYYYIFETILRQKYRNEKLPYVSIYGYVSLVFFDKSIIKMNFFKISFDEDLSFVTLENTYLTHILFQHFFLLLFKL